MRRQNLATTTPLCTRYALDKLKRTSLVAMATENDRAFCIIDKEQCHPTMKQTLRDNHQEQIRPHSLVFKDLSMEYAHICGHIMNNHGDTRLATALLADMWRPEGTEIAPCRARSRPTRNMGM